MFYFKTMSGKSSYDLTVTILCEQANVKPLWLPIFKLLLSGLWSPIMFRSTATSFSQTASTGPTGCPCFLLKDSLASFTEPPFTSYAILKQMISKYQAVRENWPLPPSLLPLFWIPHLIFTQLHSFIPKLNIYILIEMLTMFPFSLNLNQAPIQILR